MIKRLVSTFIISFLFFTLHPANAESTVSRYDAVDTLWKIFDMQTHPEILNTKDSLPVYFVDIAFTDSHYTQLASLCVYQVLDCTGGTFNGAQPVTYPSLFKMAFAMAAAKDKTSTFAVESNPEWHVPYMNKALERGLISDASKVGEVSQEDLTKITNKLSILRSYYFTVPTYFKGLEKNPQDLTSEMFTSLKEIDDTVSIYKELYGDLVTKWASKDTPVIDKILLASSMARLKIMLPRAEEIAKEMHSHPLFYDTTYPEDLRLLFKQHNIKELVGEGVYDFSNNASYRKWNIQHSIKNIDKLVLQPGEEFNYWDVMYKGGLDQVKNGWLIVGNKEVWGWGGGLCGTATAIFRGAWMAGLEITERRPHSIYYTDMYTRGEIGLDAAVYQDSPNLRFKNNTGSPLIMHTAYNTNRDIVRVQVFGTKQFNAIEFSGPVKKGNSYTQSRTFKYADGTAHTENLYSTYRKIQ